MNPIMSRIHSGVRVSIIVFWSPNIMMMYFISHSLPAPSVALSPVGRSDRAVLDIRSRRAAGEEVTLARRVRKPNANERARRPAR